MHVDQGIYTCSRMQDAHRSTPTDKDSGSSPVGVVSRPRMALCWLLLVLVVSIVPMVRMTVARLFR